MMSNSPPRLRYRRATITYPWRSSSLQARSSPRFPRTTRWRDMVVIDPATAAPTPRDDQRRDRGARREEKKDSQRTLRALRSTSWLFDLSQRLVENPDRRLRLLARQDE